MNDTLTPDVCTVCKREIEPRFNGTNDCVTCGETVCDECLDEHIGDHHDPIESAADYVLADDGISNPADNC